MMLLLLLAVVPLALALEYSSIELKTFNSGGTKNTDEKSRLFVYSTSTDELLKTLTVKVDGTTYTAAEVRRRPDGLVLKGSFDYAGTCNDCTGAAIVVPTEVAVAYENIGVTALTDKLTGVEINGNRSIHFFFLLDYKNENSVPALMEGIKIDKDSSLTITSNLISSKEANLIYASNGSHFKEKINDIKLPLSSFSVALSGTGSYNISAKQQTSNLQKVQHSGLFVNSLFDSSSQTSFNASIEFENPEVHEIRFLTRFTFPDSADSAKIVYQNVENNSTVTEKVSNLTAEYRLNGNSFSVFSTGPFALQYDIDDTTLSEGSSSSLGVVFAILSAFFLQL